MRSRSKSPQPQQVYPPRQQQRSSLPAYLPHISSRQQSNQATSVANPRQQPSPYEVPQSKIQASSSAEKSYLVSTSSVNLPPYAPEDILLCVDMDADIETELRPVTANSRTVLISKLDAIKQCLLLFVHSKLQMDFKHRIGIIGLTDDAPALICTLTNNLSVLTGAIKSLSPMGSYKAVDLSPLLQLVARESLSSKAQNRSLRMVMYYCRSKTLATCSVPHPDPMTPTYTCDLIYIHDKTIELNSKQAIFDFLTVNFEAVSQHPCYIFETNGSVRYMLKHTTLLLSLPSQRCRQDLFNPKDFTKSSSNQGPPLNQGPLPLNPKPSTRGPVPASSTGRSRDQGSGSAAAYFADPNNPYSIHQNR